MKTNALNFLPLFVVAATLFQPTVSVADINLDNAWYRLKWPPTIETQVGEAARAYGEIWVDGITSNPGSTPDLLGQLGYGPEADLPSVASWIWFDMSFLGDSGNNDEFFGDLVPATPGVYAYTVRFSGNQGATWVYGDLNGPGYTIGEGGRMTVTAIPEPGSSALLVCLVTGGLTVRRRRLDS